jgi:hypothetical protein
MLWNASTPSARRSKCASRCRTARPPYSAAAAAIRASVAISDAGLAEPRDRHAAGDDLRHDRLERRIEHARRLNAAEAGLVSGPLAAAYQAAGGTQDAIAINEPLLTDYVRILGTEHTNTLRTRHSLANPYLAAGLTDDVERLRKRLPPDSDDA